MIFETKKAGSPCVWEFAWEMRPEISEPPIKVGPN